MRRFTAIAIVFAGLALSAATASAQVPGWNPWYGQPRYYQPVLPNPGIQYLGNLPNGTPVFNPWNMYSNNNYGQNWPGGYVRPYFYNPVPAYYPGLLQTYYNYASLNNPFGSGLNVGIEREPGRFIPVARDLAINPITGTRLAPYRGVALTNEGAFLRVPGSGSFSAWGAYIPGSGVYVNPITGDVYNPGSGLIVRR